MQPRALITAGGTREPIDDVRFLSNFSRGRFGATIASELAARGWRVTLLAGVELMRHDAWVDPRVERRPFVSFGDLREGLQGYMEREGSPEMLWMTAAVPDYSPAPVEGESRSTEDELVLRLRRNPELLSGLRERCGSHTFLVGFELLSGVSRQELEAVALAQVKRCRLNLCVASDRGQLGARAHPICVVTPEGGSWPMEGGEPEVARALVEMSLLRHDVRWASTSRVEQPAPASDAGHEHASRLLRLAQEGHLFSTNDGDVSHRAADSKVDFWVTPRQVPRAEIASGDLRAVRVELDTRRVTYRLREDATDRQAKSSIDSVVQGWLYDHLPWLCGLLHVQDVLVSPTAVTTTAYPCGTIEEAEEVYATLARAVRQGEYAGGPFALELVRHGYLFGLEEGGIGRLEAQWERARQAWRAHMGEIGLPEAIDQASLSPVFDGADIVGSLADFGEAVSLFLSPSNRGTGRGDRLVRELARRRRDVVVADLCQVRGYYTARGWQVMERQGGRARLRPPAQREDLRQAASVCLVDVAARQVLLGRRQAPPWEGHWSFPGGGREPGESLEEAGARELGEECQVRAPPGPAFLKTVVHVSADDGERAYEVTNFAYGVLHRQEPVAGEELEGRWFTLAEALELGPMAPGTRHVLHRVRRVLRGGVALERERARVS